MFAILNGNKVELISSDEQEAETLLGMMNEIGAMSEKPVAYTLVSATDSHIQQYRAANGMLCN